MCCTVSEIQWGEFEVAILYIESIAALWRDLSFRAFLLEFLAALRSDNGCVDSSCRNFFLWMLLLLREILQYGYYHIQVSLMLSE